MARRAGNIECRFTFIVPGVPTFIACDFHANGLQKILFIDLCPGVVSSAGRVVSNYINLDKWVGFG